MSSIIFASICPHPPVILPSVGSAADRKIAKKTIDGLELLGRKLTELEPRSIIISSPHEEWGFQVPLFFLAPEFKGEIERVLIGSQSPAFYFNEGKKAYRKLSAAGGKIALIASGDLSHCLKEGGPYGFHPHGPKFDQDLIKFLKNKNIARILKLDEDYPEAQECGLRSICFLLGMLEESKIDYQPEILSYEGPWGVGYLTANFKITQQ